MTLQDMIHPCETEKPLDHLVQDGGFCSIFRTIGCIGDSLSSGEFESLDADGNRGYHDMFEYSWGQYIARSCGSTVYNFSRGGMTAKEYCNSFAEAMDYWNPDKLCQAYIIALGVNDLFGFCQDVGSIDDLKEVYNDNSDTFAGHYGKIIQRLRAMRPDAYFFLMTMPNEGEFDDDKRRLQKQKHRELLFAMSERFPRTYVIDLYTYAPIYDADFRRRFYMSGHLNPAGYRLTAYMVESYIDYIIRHNPEDFKQVGFIGTPHRNTQEKY